MLLIFQSIIVYGMMIWVMTYFGKIAYKSQYPQGFGGIDRFENKKRSLSYLFREGYFLIPILVFCFFAAVRFQVGVDCETYKNIFYDINLIGTSSRSEEVEAAYIFLSKFTYGITRSHYMLFFILAFLQIGLYYFALQKERQSLMFLGISLMLTGHYWSLMNGMRQNIAACAFVAMTPWLLDKKRWVFFVAGTMLATTMHRSALLLLPLGFMAYFLRNKIPNKYLQLAILAVSFALMNKLDNVFTENIMAFAGEAGYSEEEIAIYTELEATTYKFGLRMYLLYTVYCLAIFFSDKMHKVFNSKVFNIMYNMFFIGICLTLIFYNNFTIKRILYYFTCFNCVIVSYLMFYLWKNKKTSLLIITIAMLLVQTIWSVYSDVQNKGLFESSLYKFDF